MPIHIGTNSSRYKGSALPSDQYLQKLQPWIVRGWAGQLKQWQQRRQLLLCEQHPSNRHHLQHRSISASLPQSFSSFFTPKELQRCKCQVLQSSNGGSSHFAWACRGDRPADMQKNEHACRELRLHATCTCSVRFPSKLPSMLPCSKADANSTPRAAIPISDSALAASLEAKCGSSASASVFTCTCKNFSWN